MPMTNITSFKVSPVRYSVQCNRESAGSGFDARLVFDIDFIPQSEDGAWVEKVFADIRACLMATAPKSA